MESSRPVRRTVNLPTGGGSVTNFFKAWLNNDILGTNQKYASFLKTKGVV